MMWGDDYDEGCQACAAKYELRLSELTATMSEKENLIQSLLAVIEKHRKSLEKINDTYEAEQAKLIDDLAECHNAMIDHRNSLLAVIAEKDKALQKLHDNVAPVDFGATESIPYISAMETCSKALALTPENVRLVEVGWQFLEHGFWFMGSNHHNHRKNTEESGFETRPIFSIETPETSHSFIEAKGE